MGEEHAFIFDAHLLILEDRTLFLAIEKVIREENVQAEMGPVRDPSERYQNIFDAINDDYFRQRKSDVSDVLTKSLPQPGGQEEAAAKRSESEKTILVAHDLLPSEAALRLSRGNVLAVAMDMGGADLAHRHPGPVAEHPHRRRPARHHPAGQERRYPDRRRDGRRGHRQPAAGGAQGVPQQEGKIRRRTGRELQKTARLASL